MKVEVRRRYCEEKGVESERHSPQLEYGGQQLQLLPACPNAVSIQSHHTRHTGLKIELVGNCRWRSSAAPEKLKGFRLSSDHRFDYN